VQLQQLLACFTVVARQLKLTGRIQSVNVQRQVHRLLGTYTIPDLLDDASRANLVYLRRLHDLEPTVSVVLVVARSAERSADAGVYVAIVG
jgi:hypothetical protein